MGQGMGQRIGAMRRAARRLLLAVALGLGAPAAFVPSANAQGLCRTMDFEGTPFTVCAAKAGQDVRLFLRDGQGAILGSFGAVDDQLAAEGKKLAFAMNAGMYHPDRRPVGLYIEKGETLAPLQKREGPGNFGMVPNGVFCVTDSDFRVVETLAFAKAPPACRYATQSGPMLLIDGAVHPKFASDSDAVNLRNGVGVSPDGKTALFAISGDLVNFDTFARFYRDALGVRDALFLDGTISRLYAPGLGRDDFGFQMGPIVGLVVPRF